MSKNIKATQGVDDTLINAVSGDISYEELQKVEGISAIALKVKKENSTSFFKRASFCPLSNIKECFISYKNVDLLKRFVSPRGKIIATRSSNVKNYKKQKMLRKAILHARFLGLLPYVKY